MSYTKKTWENLPSTNTPLNATGVNDLETRIDTGIKDADALRVAPNTIVTNDDLNSFTSAGTYKCNTATIAASLTNNPHTTSAFKLIVMKLHDDTRYVQIIVAADNTSSLYIRSYTNAGWGEWQTIRNKGYFFQGTSSLTGSTTIDLTNYQDGKTHIIEIAMSHHNGAHYTFLEYVYRSNGTNTAFNLVTSKQAGNINVTASVSGATLTINNSGPYGGTLTVIMD